MPRLRRFVWLLAARALASVPAPAQNLLANAHFDADLQGWIVEHGTLVGWMYQDGDDCLSSGSFHGESVEVSGFSEFEIFQCIAQTPAQGTVYYGSGRIRATSGLMGVGVRFYSDALCTNEIGANSTSLASSLSWTRVDATSTAPAGVNGIAIHLFAGGVAPTTVVGDFDVTWLGPARPLFVDSFEARGTCRWNERSGFAGECSTHAECDVAGECCYLGAPFPGVGSCVPGGIVAGACIPAP